VFADLIESNHRQAVDARERPKPFDSLLDTTAWNWRQKRSRSKSLANQELKEQVSPQTFNLKLSSSVLFFEINRRDLSQVHDLPIEDVPDFVQACCFIQVAQVGV